MSIADHLRGRIRSQLGHSSAPGTLEAVSGVVWASTPRPVEWEPTTVTTLETAAAAAASQVSWHTSVGSQVADSAG